MTTAHDDFTARPRRVRLSAVHRGTQLGPYLRLGTLGVPWLDALATGALLALALGFGVGQATAPAQFAGMIVAATSPLARHRSPLICAGLLLAGVLAVALGGPGEVECGEMLPAIALVMFGAGGRAGYRVAPGAGVLGLAALVVEAIQDPVLAGSGLGGTRRDRRDERRGAGWRDGDRGGAERDRVRGADAARRHAQRARGAAPPRRRSDAGPQPSPRDVDRLLEQARTRGVEVTLRSEGQERAVATAADRCAYRIIERAVQGAAGSVDVLLGDRELELELELEIRSGERSAWTELLAVDDEPANRL